VEAVVGPGLATGERRTARLASPPLESTRGRTLVLAVGLGVCLFLLAWLPRVAVLDQYLTTDEGNWMGRTALFSRALRDGDPLGTYQSGHPGVTTMWAALAGLGPERAIGLAEYVRPDGLEKAPGYLDLLRDARRPFPILTSLAVVAICLLTWRLFGAGPALLLGVLLALQPFFLAHSGVVHLDGMLTSYMTVAYLSALVYWGRGGGTGYLVLAGLATGLAFLTKTPSALLALLIPGLALIASRLRGRLATRRDLGRLALEGLAWGGLAGGLALALWPALRADFVGTLQNMVGYTEAVGGSDHENFFLGQPVGDPGPLYYLVSFGFRAAPASLLGLGLLAVMLLPVGPRRPSGRVYGLLLGLLAFVVLFSAMMMQPPKKFDRYLLPTFPTWEIMAALGYWLTLQRLAPGLSGRLLPVLLLVLGAAQALMSLQVYPYYLAYYNPLLGGGKAAARSIVVGWGEGLDQVTSYLNQRPDAERLTLAGFYPRVLMAQFKGNVLPDKQYDEAEADYIVLYVNALQRDLANTLRTETRGRRAELVVTINGAEYARLYRVPPPSNRSASGTEFGALRLDRSFLRTEDRRYLKSDDIHAGDTLLVTLRWTLLRPVEQVYYANLALVDRQGRAIAQTTDQIGGPDESTLSIRPGDFLTEVHQLPVPTDAAGDYQLAVGVRLAPDGPLLPVTAWPERLGQEARRLPNRVLVDSIQASSPEETEPD
jgi:4-amino-4-deoxy-L-arabinose transferase-like glycosyltransferase